MGKVQVDGTMLKNLAVIAKRLGTQNGWIDLALEWIDLAEKEIEELKKFKVDCIKGGWCE